MPRKTKTNEFSPRISKWHIAGGRALETPAPFGIMGIVNLTPDSFYDGGCYATAESGIRHALQLHNDGADIVDLGAETTKPGAEALSAKEEKERLLPVLNAVRTATPGMIVSVDTYHAETAASALEMGAAIINDISACSFEPELVDVLVQYKPGYVLTHNKGKPKTMQDRPRYANVRHEVASFFEREITHLVKAGLPENRIVLDPGIGFGKTGQQNLELLAHTEEWLPFGRPVLMALSMKSVFGFLLDLPPDKRAVATQVATALLWENGIFWHRVHDVATARQTLALAAALRRKQNEKFSA